MSDPAAAPTYFATMPAAADGLVISAARQLYAGEHQPTGALELLLRDAQSAETTSFRFRPGAEIALEFGERYCPGYADRDGEHHPCAQFGIATETHQWGYTCLACAKLHHIPTAMKAAARDRPTRRLRKEPHAVYLAAYGDGQIKVGTARSARLGFRLSEQGARAALILARVEHEKAALDLEQALTVIGYSDRQHPTHRLRSLAGTLDTETLLAALRHEANKLRRRIGLVQIAYADELETLTIAQPALDTPQPLPGSLKQISVGVQIAGSLVRTVGGFLILDEGGDLTAFSLRSMTNRQITVLAQDEWPDQQLGLFAGGISA